MVFYMWVICESKFIFKKMLTEIITKVRGKKFKNVVHLLNNVSCVSCVILKVKYLSICESLLPDTMVKEPTFHCSQIS